MKIQFQIFQIVQMDVAIPPSFETDYKPSNEYITALNHWGEPHDTREKALKEIEEFQLNDNKEIQLTILEVITK